VVDCDGNKTILQPIEWPKEPRDSEREVKWWIPNFDPFKHCNSVQTYERPNKICRNEICRYEKEELGESVCTVTPGSKQMMGFHHLLHATPCDKRKTVDMFGELKRMAACDSKLNLKRAERKQLFRQRLCHSVKAWQVKGGGFEADVYLVLGDSPGTNPLLTDGSCSPSANHVNPATGHTKKSRQRAVQQACINAMSEKQYLGVWAQQHLGRETHVVLHHPPITGMKKKLLDPIFALLPARASYLYTLFINSLVYCPVVHEPW